MEAAVKFSFLKTLLHLSDDPHIMETCSFTPYTLNFIQMLNMQNETG